MELRLATFNLLNLGVRPGEENREVLEWLPRHVSSLHRMLRRMDADAVAIQELIDPALLGELTKGLGYLHAVLSVAGTSPLRCGVLSRHPLRESRPVAGETDLALADHDTGLEFRLRGAFSRSALEVTWCAPGLGDVILLVVHWKSKIPSAVWAAQGTGGWESLEQVGRGRLLTEVKRLGQAVELRGVADRHLTADPAARLAVLGDFNDGLESEGLRIVMGDARAARADHLEGFELSACELAVPIEHRFTQIYRRKKEMLDHLLVSRSLLASVADTRILNEALAETDDTPAPRPATAPGGDGAPATSASGGGWRPSSDHADSDHAPLVVTFRV